MKGVRILEAGSGAGRFTEILLSTGAEVYSFDSSSAVDANIVNNGHSPNLRLFQADIFNLPLKNEAFDKVLCLGVLQHTPDPEEAFHCLRKCLRPGGKIVVDIYSKRLVSLLSWKYVFRPLTRRMDKERLYSLSVSMVDLFLPLSSRLYRLGLKAGGRLLPIASYPHLNLSYELHREWAILDTFDMYAPAYDYPQSRSAVARWFRENGLIDVHIKYGPNGIIAKGRRPET